MTTQNSGLDLVITFPVEIEAWFFWCRALSVEEIDERLAAIAERD